MVICDFGALFLTCSVEGPYYVVDGIRRHQGEAIKVICKNCTKAIIRGVRA